MGKMAQCYKILINDTCSFEDVWYGRNAKIFEGCELSQDGADEEKLELYTWEIKKKKEDRTWIGTMKPYSDTYCKPLPLIGKTTTDGTFAYNDNVRTWAKSAYTFASSWYTARAGANGTIGGSKSWVPVPKDIFPHYQLPW